MVLIQKYRLELVKESNNKYDVDKKISSPKDSYEFISKVYETQKYAEEVLLMVTLNTKNIVTGCFEVARGSINSTVVHPREVYKRALLNNAASILVFHNHPSGDPSPSKEDVNITARLKECGKLLGIDLLDHIILGEDSYISLKEKGLL